MMGVVVATFGQAWQLWICMLELGINYVLIWEILPTVTTSRMFYNGQVPLVQDKSRMIPSLFNKRTPLTLLQEFFFWIYNTR